MQIRAVRFTVPDDYKWAPSTDGIDLDSCQDVVVDNCFFSVTDDCVALKGSRGPHATEDKLSPPDERVLITRCVFKRGHAGRELRQRSHRGARCAGGNPGQTDISDITLENIAVKVKEQKFVRENVKNLQLKNVVVIGTPLAN